MSIAGEKQLIKSEKNNICMKQYMKEAHGTAFMLMELHASLCKCKQIFRQPGMIPKILKTD